MGGTKGAECGGILSPGCFKLGVKLGIVLVAVDAIAARDNGGPI